LIQDHLADTINSTSSSRVSLITTQNHVVQIHMVTTSREAKEETPRVRDRSGCGARLGDEWLSDHAPPGAQTPSGAYPRFRKRRFTSEKESPSPRSIAASASRRESLSSGYRSIWRPSKSRSARGAMTAVGRPRTVTITRSRRARRITREALMRSSRTVQNFMDVPVDQLDYLPWYPILRGMQALAFESDVGFSRRWTGDVERGEEDRASTLGCGVALCHDASVATARSSLNLSRGPWGA